MIKETIVECVEKDIYNINIIIDDTKLNKHDMFILIEYKIYDIFNEEYLQYIMNKKLSKNEFEIFYKKIFSKIKNLYITSDNNIIYYIKDYQYDNDLITNLINVNF